MKTKILGSPIHLFDLPHPDDVLPFMEIGYTKDGAYATVITQNVRDHDGRGHWRQTPADIAVRIAFAQLIAAGRAIEARTESTTAINATITQAIEALPVEQLSQLSRICSQAAINAIRRGRAPVVSIAGEIDEPEDPARLSDGTRARIARGLEIFGDFASPEMRMLTDSEIATAIGGAMPETHFLTESPDCIGHSRVMPPDYPKLTLGDYRELRRHALIAQDRPVDEIRASFDKLPAHLKELWHDLDIEQQDFIAQYEIILPVIMA